VVPYRFGTGVRQMIAKIPTKILDLARTHQQGRVGEIPTVVEQDFTEGWFRDSGLYELWPCYQSRVMNELLPGWSRAPLLIRTRGI
jgi:hypothetical protein